MSAWYRSRAVKGVLIAVITIVLLLVALQVWLSSGIGRGLVESRLSAALGRPARLDGEFDLRLLPVPGASGTDLRVFTRDARWLALDAGGYLARLSLWPLFKGEVEVVALRLEDAAVDLGKLAAEPAAPVSPGEYFPLPEIASFRLADVALRFDGMRSEPYLQIGELSVDGFRVDAPAPFEAEAAIVSEGAERLTMSTGGTLTLRSGGLAETTFSRLDIASDGWAIQRIEGGVAADFERSMLEVGLKWGDGGRGFELDARVAWDPLYPRGEEGYAIEEIELTFGKQRISGSGCLLGESPPVLHLALSSKALDLQALYALMDEWRASGIGARQGRGPGIGRNGSPNDGDAGLPFGLALSLEIEEATYGDAVASGIRLSAGAGPDCPEAL